LEHTIAGIDQPHLGKARAFLICSGSLQWRLPFTPSRPLDNPNPASHHYFCAIREGAQWYWWDTIRNHQPITNLPGFVVTATRNGRLFVFRDAVLTNAENDTDINGSVLTAQQSASAADHQPARGPITGDRDMEKLPKTTTTTVTSIVIHKVNVSAAALEIFTNVLFAG
jgi:hypothetical protein